MVVIAFNYSSFFIEKAIDYNYILVELLIIASLLIVLSYTAVTLNGTKRFVNIFIIRPSLSYLLIGYNCSNPS